MIVIIIHVIHNVIFVTTVIALQLLLTKMTVQNKHLTVVSITLILTYRFSIQLNIAAKKDKKSQLLI